MTIIGLIFGAVGAPLSVIGLRQWWTSRHPKQLTWKHVEHAIQNLKHAIRTDHYQPDVVIGLRRSGAVVGGMLAGVLGNRPIMIVNWNYEWRDGDRKIVDLQWGFDSAELSGKKILLIDGRPTSGTSLGDIRERLTALTLSDPPAEIRTAALFKFGPSRVTYDYVGTTLLVPSLHDTPPWKLGDPEYIDDQHPKDRRS